MKPRSSAVVSAACTGTAFSKAARDAGCTVVSGLDMLLHQGAAQLEWWLERPVFETPAIAVMRQALEEAVDENPRKTIRPVSTINARIRLPGSKSITHRALMMAALSQGPAEIANPLKAEDTFLTAGRWRPWAQ